MACPPFCKTGRAEEYDLARAYMKSSWHLVLLQSERSAGRVNSLAYKLAKTQQLTKTSTNQPTTSQAHQHIKSPAQKLKLLPFILQ